MATVAELNAVMSANAGNFLKGFDQAIDKMQETEKSSAALGEKMSATGAKLTKSVTLPLVAAGAGAAKLSMDFDQSMSKITGLVGIAGDEVEAMKGQVLELAGETARAPQELADAMFFIQSAGLRGSDAMEALESSAMAAAGGMGETKDIALATGAVFNAYKSSGMDAARATEILAETARAGNFEASQLAGSIGRVLPIASAAGVSFEEVGGAIALMTRVNGDAGQSVTQLTSLIGALNAPLDAQRQMFEDAGLSVETLQATIAQPGGLVEAMKMVETAAGGDASEMRKLLGSQEALSLGLTLLNSDAETLEGTFGAVTGEAGVVGEAFDAAQTDGFKMQQAMVDVQVALIKVGDIAGPVAAKFAGAVAHIASGLSSLPAPAQSVVVGVLGVAAALGPVLSIAGKVSTRMSELSVAHSKGSKMAGVQMKAMKGLGVAMGAIAGLGLAAELLNIAQHMGDLKVDVEGLSKATTDELVAGFLEMQKVADEMNLGDIELELFQQVADENIGTAQRLRDALEAEGEEVGELDTILASATERQAQLAEDTAASTVAVDAATTVVDAAQGPLAAYADSLRDGTAATTESTDALETYSDTLNAMFDPMFGMVDAQNAVRDAEAEFELKQWEVIAAVEDYGATSLEAMEATRELESAEWDLLAANLDLSAAEQELIDQINSGQMPLQNAIAAIDQLEDSEALSASAAAALRDNIYGFSDAARKVPGEIKLSVDPGNTALGRLHNLTNAAYNLSSAVSSASSLAINAAASYARSEMAEGGLVTTPTNARIGEAGPELVLPLNNPRRMGELLSSVLGNGGASDTPTTSTVRSGPTTETIQLVVDGTVLSEVLRRREETLS